jgi:sugar porter (SP) family MFS transporter
MFKLKFIYVVAAIAALAGLLFGYDTGVISGAILFIKNDFHLSAGGEGMVVSAVLFGATLGALVSGELADFFGRKKIILIISAVFAIGSILTALATSVTAIVIGRVVLGLAIGVASFTAPLYIGEVSPPAVRGALVGLNQLAITIGILASYIVDYAFAASGNWQAMVALGAVPAVILAIGITFMPESPRWLMIKDKEEEARRVLKNIGRENDLELELKEIKQIADSETGGWKELFSPSLRPLLLIGAALAFFQQFTGINTVIYYAPTIFNLAGFESNSVSILATAGVGLVNVLMTIIGLQFIDRVGRRPLLLAGLTGMAISLFALSFGFMSQNNTEALKWIGVASLALYVAAFAISIGPIFWLIIAEIYPLKIRGLAMSCATGCCWISNLVVSFTFPLLLKYLNTALTFSLYGAIAVVAIIFCFFMVPETKGVSLEELQERFKIGIKKPF